MEQDINEEVEKNSLPRIGEKAPAFRTQTTQGEISLEDYKGKWVVLFSHPSDFTPICTSEFVAFQGVYSQLKEMNTELIGLSVDSVSSHIAWLQNIEETFNTTIEFPLIADLSKEISMDYGMLDYASDNTETSRAVFVIDDQSTVRSIIYYPMSTGRNIDEIVRLVEALQTTDQTGNSTPANWESGDKVVVPPPKTLEEARERKDNSDCKSWYYCETDIK